MRTAHPTGRANENQQTSLCRYVRPHLVADGGAEHIGPTVGDKVRLADTDLWIEVEKDFTTYGEEVKFGGGKVIRDGMGQGQLCAKDVVDTLGGLS